MELQTHSEEQTSKSISKHTYFLAATVLASILIIALFIYYKKVSSLSSSEEFGAVDKSISITYSNGNQYYLNKQKLGITFNENALSYNDGTLISNSIKSEAFLKQAKFSPDHLDFIVINNLSNQKYQIKLPDSTKIWLNGNSSMKVPKDFHKSDKRILQLVGEAYFDVSEINKEENKQPFIVLTEGQMVEVYGTKFNLASYPTKKITKTTLVEGSLKVTQLPTENIFVLPQVEPTDIKSLLPKKKEINVAKEIYLKPNQQLTLSTGKITIDEVEVEEVIAWKSDTFDYRYVSLERIMKVVSVWYGVTVVFHDEKAKHILLGGTIDRNTTLKNILTTLSLTCEIRIRQVGNKVIVST